MTLPVDPPIKPQLARPAKDLPDGPEWRYEPKWDGFRTIVFRDGDEVYLQSRNGKPMNRYFPEIAAQITALSEDRLVLDGELMVVVDGVQEFDLLGQRIHPAKSRVDMMAEKWPATFVAFDALAIGGETLMELTFDKRRSKLEKVVPGTDPKAAQLTPMTPDRDAAGVWLTGASEGVIAKQAGSMYLPGERKGMYKIKRVRTADVVVAAFRFGKEAGTIGSLILGLYDDAGELHIVGHTSGFTAKQKRELVGVLEPYRTYEQGSGEASRWKSEEELVWQGLRPELVCEIAFDHISGNRIRHGAKFQRWRPDKQPGECRIEQLRS
jgi:ATP-dependent DNA ligase